MVKNDSVRVEQNGRININVLANDTDAEGDSLRVRGVLTDAKHSQLLVVNTDGTIHYRPQLEFVGQDSFIYLVDDGNEGLAGGTVYVTVFPFYRAIDDTVYIMSGTSKSFPILDNDQYDRDRDSLYVTTLTPGAQTERVVLNTNQTLFYESKDGFLGIDTLAYTSATASGRTFGARVFVHNTLPSFAKNDSIVIRQGGRLNVWPLDNDWVFPGDSLQLVSYGQATHAERVVQNSNGTLHYRPQANFLGQDQFLYTVSDKQGQETSAFVVVDVLPLNKAVPDTVGIREGGRINIDVLANDLFYGSTQKQVLGFTPGEKSERVVLNSNGTLHYRPLPGVFGEDQFTYEIGSGQENGRSIGVVVVQVRALRDIFLLAPDSARVFANQSIVIDVLGNDRHNEESPLQVVDVSVNGDAVILQNGLVFFKPTAIATFVRMTYTVEDSVGSKATQQVVIEQRPEVAVGFSANDFAEVAHNDSVFINVLGNDRGGLRLADVDVAKHGQVQVVDGRVLYVPQAGFIGEDVFIYIAADEANYRVAARVFVKVTEPKGVTNPPPQGVTGDFDGDKQVGFGDFLLFVAQFGLKNSDSKYDARMDLDADGQIAFTDFLQFVGLFGRSGN